MEWVGLGCVGRDPKDHFVSIPYCGQSHLQLEGFAQNPTQPGTEHFRDGAGDAQPVPAPNRGFGSREVTMWLWWKGICEWKKLLSSTDLNIDHTPSITIPVCKGNTPESALC